jgi:hypothetical protein
MRFVRHLTAATLVVAVVVILGLAWNHFAASTLIGNIQGSFRQEIVTSRPAEASSHGPVTPAPGHKVSNLGTMDLGLNSMLDPVNLPYLRHTVIIEAGVMAAVVIIDAGRRKSRRARRAAQFARSGSGDDDDADQ